MERTCFQVEHPYDRRIDLKSDVAIVYGLNPSLNKRVTGWRENGYIVHLMAGIAWGEYQDYLYGGFDGRKHFDDAQMDRNGNRVSHGGDVYYMVPSKPFIEYLKSLLKQALDSGVEAIHLEEPEFWVRSGYSKGFKREWKEFYGTEWVNPASSEDASYKASKLKQFLYFRIIRELAFYVKSYSEAKGKTVRFYIPTHSLINYTHWRIVSPESLLLEIPQLDGLIAQVWTGTSRTPNLFKGIVKERTFEAAFMEYGDFSLSDVGMLVSDTMMFQKPDISSFYGIVLPLLKTGVFVQSVPMENLKNLSEDYKILFLSYEFMKPPSKKSHKTLARWVSKGGILIYVDDIQDPYNSVCEWWKEKGYEAPAFHLFNLLGVKEVGEGDYRLGKGRLIFKKQSPKKLARNKEGASFVLDLLKEVKAYKEQNYLMLRRGAYVIAAVMDESALEDPLLLKGSYIDIFNPDLPVVKKKLVNPGEIALLYDLGKLNRIKPKVLLSASRISDEDIQEDIFTFLSRGPEGVRAKTRVFLPSKPKGIKVETLNEKGQDFQQLWDEDSSTLLLTYENLPEGLRVEVRF